MKKASIFWCTGMSGVGKSTLSEYAKSELENHGYNILIIDGDVIRTQYKIQLGFDRMDVEKNNLYVVKLCKNERYNYDAIIVPIISPINTVRSTIRRLLSPSYHLVYIYSWQKKWLVHHKLHIQQYFYFEYFQKQAMNCNIQHNVYNLIHLNV